MIDQKVRRTIKLLLTWPLFLLLLASCARSHRIQEERDKIIYYQDDYIYEMSGDGENRRILVDCKVVDYCLTSRYSPLSPDGKKVLYYREEDGKLNLGIVNLDGSERKELASGLPVNVPWIGWSFDGRYIAFSVSPHKREITQDKIYTLDVSSGEMRQIMEGRVMFAWSPVENLIAVSGGYSRGEEFEFGFYLVNPETGQEQRVLANPFIGWFDWSPDGQRLVLSMWGHGIENPTSVFVIDTDGQDLRELTVDGEYEYSYAGRPKWSPDGRHILYIGDYTSKEGSGVNALFVVNVETGEQRKLVDGVEVTDFLWSPDGQEIAFYSGKDHLLCKVSISDGKVTKLADKGLGVLAWK